MSHSFTSTSNIFEDETVFHEEYTPEALPERAHELEQIHFALGRAVRGYKPPNMLIYGKAGQGKTAGVEYKLDQLQEEIVDEAPEVDLGVVRYNCANDTSSYTVFKGLIDQLCGVSMTGRTLRELKDKFFEEIQKIGDTIIIMLDEIDAIGSDDEILYTIPRAHEVTDNIPDDLYISLIGISNDYTFKDELGQKEDDSLNEDVIDFAPYNANQLNSILYRRSEKAFKDDVLEDGVIPLCSAHAAQDKGSARQAIQLLYKSGEIASNNGEETVTEEHVEKAVTRVEREHVQNGIREMTMQDKLTLAALVSCEVQGKTPVRTKGVYSQYKRITDELDANRNAIRSVRTHLQDLDMMGIAEYTKRTTGARGGNHYIFELDTNVGITIEALSHDSRIEKAIDLVTENKSIEDYIED